MVVKEFHEITQGRKKAIDRPIQIKGLKLTDNQQYILNQVNNPAKYKYIICNLARQTGKSTLAQLLLCQWLLEKNRSICYITPQAKLSRLFFSSLVKIFHNANGFFTTVNKTELKIECINGTILQFFSSENLTAIRGNTFDYMVLDEVAFMREETSDSDKLWENILLPAFSVKGKKCLAISTPFGKQGLFYDLCMRAQNMGYKNKWKYIERDIYTSTLIDEEQIEEIKSITPKLAFDQEFLCKFLDNAITYFSGFENCFCDDMEYIENLPYWVGIDLSFTDGGDATILTKINTLNQVKSIEIKGELDSKYEQINNYLSDPKIIKCYVEDNGGGKVMLNEITKNVKNKKVVEAFNTNNNTKTEIINLLATTVQQREVLCDGKDRLLFNEFGTFIYKITKTKKLSFGAKDGFHDDRIMSLAIGLKCKYDNPNNSSNLRGRYINFPN